MSNVEEARDLWDEILEIQRHTEAQNELLYDIYTSVSAETLAGPWLPAAIIGRLRESLDIEEIEK